MAITGKGARGAKHQAARNAKTRRALPSIPEQSARPATASSRRLAALCAASFLTLAASPAARGQSVDPAVPNLGLGIDARIGYMFDDNVTRAPSGPDKLSDSFYSLDASKTFAFPPTEYGRLTVQAFGGGELTRNYPGLGRIFGGGEAALQYRASTELDAPFFAVFIRGLGEHYGSELRSGYRYAGGVSVRQNITHEIELFASYTHNWRYANSSVFDTRDNAYLVSAGYTVDRYGTFTLTGEYRRGTLVSTGQKTLTIIDIAQVFVNDDVFTSPQMIDYRFEAKSVLTTLDWTLPLGSSYALDVSWRRTQSKSTEQASFPGGGSIRYVDNQFNVFFLFSF